MIKVAKSVKLLTGNAEDNTGPHIQGGVTGNAKLLNVEG